MENPEWVGSSGQKVLARLGIKPGSPAYMEDVLTTELLTMLAEMSGGTMTDGS